jgi:hypothetical protein
MAKHTVIFKVRPEKGPDQKPRIKIKKSYSRRDYQGPGNMYSNSDIFPQILLMAVSQACELRSSTFRYLDPASLPPRVTLDSTSFLTTVTVDLTGLPRFD